MKLDIYQVDAFANDVFQGNPAAVCPLDEWLSDELMQKISAENNLSETAFFVQEGDTYYIRWFTPAKEVCLCGHATLASAYIIFEFLKPGTDKVVFDSKSGELLVDKKDSLFSLNFPVSKLKYSENNPLFGIAFGTDPKEILEEKDYILIYEDEKTIREIKPDFEVLKKLDLRGVCITAKGDECDFVYRFFAPKYGINEDPVTGSVCTQLLPYWQEQFEKNSFEATQLSLRGGKILCELKDDRTLISGYAVLYLKGEIYV